MSNGNSNKRLALRGFSLIEALASVTLLAVGVAAVVSGLGAVTRAETRMRKIEIMTRLAQHKFDELVATSSSMTAGAAQSGDFSDQNLPDYSWTCDIADTGVTNLEAVTVKVTLVKDTSSSAPIGKVSSLLYVPPASTTSTTTTAGGQ